MKSEVLNSAGYTVLPIIAMILFALVFLGVVFKTMRKSNESDYKESEQLPLDLNNQENNNE
ncbi:MAG: cbb3-type cytochrome c oxidase subunit 3 [Halobacteriovoraceae bacterium]|nr:cbb3-type cytochrome c oxidase subunit 3 [Halobacteriovoraceae bacterium]